MWHQGLIDGPIHVEGDDGYHLNIAPALMSALLNNYQCNPGTPQRVFAGTDTLFLRFTDETEARTVLSAWWHDD
jgi:hypothetical protein